MSPKEEWAGHSGVGLTVVAVAAGVAMTAEGAALACSQGEGTASRPTPSSRKGKSNINHYGSHVYR